MANLHLYVPCYNESALADTDFVYVMDRSTHTILSTIPIGTNVHSISTAIHPNGNFVYVANAGGFNIDTEETISSSISVIDTTKNIVVHTISLELQSGLRYIAITPDGTLLYAVFHPNDIWIIQLSDDTILAKISTSDKQEAGIIISSDGTAYVPYSNGVNVISPVTKTIKDVISLAPWKGQPRSIALEPSGERLYVYTGVLSIYSTATNKEIRYIKIRDPASYVGEAMTISPDSKWLYICNQEEDCVMVIDTNTYKTMYKMMIEPDPLSMALSKDGKWLYVVHSSFNTISCIDLTKSYVVSTISTTHVSYSLSNAYGICCGELTLTVKENNKPNKSKVKTIDLPVKPKEEKKIEKEIEKEIPVEDLDLDTEQIIFNWQGYILKYPDLQKAGIKTREEAWNHWINLGKKENRSIEEPKEEPETEFDWEMYVTNYPDLQKAGITTEEKAWNHWIALGKAEKRTDRNLLDEFDWNAYLDKYPDLEEAGINTKKKAWKHWNEHGIAEERSF